MVWIPGGMFEFHGTGASKFYDGSRFARDGIVLVSVGYRVGVEGFLYLDDGVANLGLLDQIAALEWVRENIDTFGGDARSVTVFGQSAGAMSVATLLSMPAADGLFRRAIVESGTARNVNSAETAARIGRRLAQKLDVPATREAVAALSVERVLQAQQQLREELLANPDPTIWGEVASSYLPWAPTVDGKCIPARPIDGVRNGAGGDVALLVGTNTEETRLFFVSDGSIDRITDESVRAIAAAYGLSPEGLDAYRAASPTGTAGDLFSAIQTDWYWRIPAMDLADAHAAHARASTFMYEFAWRSPQSAGRLGAAHAVEIPFVFDTLGLGTEPLLGREPPQPLATAMHGAWVKFARDGDCGWPRYDATQRPTMHFDVTSSVVNDPLGSRRVRWTTAAVS
jgi:para-nitrobenzyl esterase